MIDKLKNFKNLNSRQKLLVAGLGLSLGFSLYFNILYKPLAKKVNRYRFQIKKSASRLKDLKGKFPAIEKQKENLRSLDFQCKDLLIQITEIEKDLPSEKNSSRLLTELSRLAKDLKLLSLRQKIDSGEEYSRIFIEFKFSEPYQKLINYLNRVESLSPFLMVEELEIFEPKTKKESGIQTRLVLSSLLGTVSSFELIKGQESEDIELARDIFISRSRPAARVSKVELKLEGITYAPSGSTAIINTDVVKVGSKVGNLTVKEITSEKVILTDGIEDQVLSVSR